MEYYRPRWLVHQETSSRGFLSSVNSPILGSRLSFTYTDNSWVGFGNPTTVPGNGGYFTVQCWYICFFDVVETYFLFSKDYEENTMTTYFEH